MTLGYLDRLRTSQVKMPSSRNEDRTNKTPLISTHYVSSSFSSVSEKSYSQLVDAYKSWTYTCVDKLSKSIAMIPLKLHIFRSKQTGKVLRDISWKGIYRTLKTKDERDYFIKTNGMMKEEIFDHPFLQLINRPNTFMTRFALWYNIVIRLELSGLCGLLKVRDGLNVPRQLYPLPLTKHGELWAKVSPQGELEYWTYRSGNIFNKYDPSEIIPLIYPHPASPFQGMSPLMAQTYPYDIDLFLMQQQRAFFEHGANPGLHLTTDQILNEEQIKEIKNQINSQYAGALKSGDTLITHSGLKAQALGQTARQAMIDEIARFARDKLITSFDLSPAKVGLVEDVNRANMAGLDRTFIHEALRPKCMLIEESIETFLLPDYDKGLTCDFILPSTEDEELELRAMETRLRTKLTVINEERGRLGMKPVPWGDLPWGSALEVQHGSKEPAASKPNDNDEDETATFKSWTPEQLEAQWKLFVIRSENLEQLLLAPIRSYFKTLLSEILIRLEREGKRYIGLYNGWSKQRILEHFKANPPARINIDKILERKRLIALVEPKIMIIMKETGDARLNDLQESIKAELNQERKFQIEFNVNDPRVLKWLGRRMREFSKEVTNTTFDEIAAILREGFTEGHSIVTISETLSEKFTMWDKYRAPLIARTETISAMNQADLEAVHQSGLEEQLLKHWLTAGDEAVRETHVKAGLDYADGISVDEEFVVGTDRMKAPGNGRQASENINCRCTLYYTQKNKGGLNEYRA